jgi:hypothetical protein
MPAATQPIEISFTLYDGGVIVVDGQMGDVEYQKLPVDTASASHQ